MLLSIYAKMISILQRTERALGDLTTVQGTSDDANREKQLQIRKMESEVKDMEEKLARADKSV